MRKGLLQVSMYLWAVTVCLTLGLQAQTISTLAGGGPNNLPATSSSIGYPWATAVDPITGNTYISDSLSNRIFIVNKGSGTLTVFAGNSVAAYSGDGGSPTAATLSGPRGIAVDGSGNLYIADANTNTIRVVNTTSGSVVIAGVTVASGTIATIAGNGTSCLSTASTTCGDGGAAVGPTLTTPSGVFVDSTGNVFIADTVDNRVRKVSTSGTITTLAGTGAACSAPTAACGDGGTATSAQLFRPTSIFVDGSGNIYIADSGDHRIREVIASTGKISTIAGTGATCAAPTNACGDGGPATAAQLNLATTATAFNAASYFGGVTLDASGNIYIADSVDNRIRVVNPSGSLVTVQGVTIPAGDIATIAGTGNICTYSARPCGDGGSATSATLTNPSAVLVSGTNVIIADQTDDVVRVVSAGTIDFGGAPLAGKLRDQTYSGDGSAPLDAEIGQPPAAYSDTSGNIFIADTFNGAIRELNAAGTTLSTLVGGQSLCSVAPCGDGAASLGSVRLGYISDIFVDGSNNIFFADYEPSTSPLPQAVIREIPAEGAPVKLIAGQYGTLGYSGDGGPATSALLGGPATSPAYISTLIKGLGLTLDKNGVIYIADTVNHAIRVVNSTTSPVTIAGVAIQPGDIATVAGNGTACSSAPSACGDGGAATSAQLNVPSGVAVDGSGNIYIADTFDNRIREVVASSGVIQAFAGTGTACSGSSCGDGGAATSAKLNYPIGVAVDGNGNVFIGDAKDAVVREVTAFDGHIQTVAGSYKRGFSGDGGAATSARLAGPYGVAFDASGNLLISDSPGWRIRKVTNVAGTDFTITASALSPASVSAGGTSTSTITLTAVGGFNSAVALTCSVSPTSAPAPTCGFSSSSVTPTSGGATTTLTISTTAASAMLAPGVVPGEKHREMFYAVWLLLPAMLFSTAGMGSRKRRKLLCGLLAAIAVVGCLFLASCSSTSKTNTGGKGTPAGQYTVTVTAAAGSDSKSVSPALTLTVQ